MKVKSNSCSTRALQHHVSRPYTHNRRDLSQEKSRGHTITLLFVGADPAQDGTVPVEPLGRRAAEAPLIRATIEEAVIYGRGLPGCTALSGPTKQSCDCCRAFPEGIAMRLIRFSLVSFSVPGAIAYMGCAHPLTGEVAEPNIVFILVDNLERLRRGLNAASTT